MTTAALAALSVGVLVVSIVLRSKTTRSIGTSDKVESRENRHSSSGYILHNSVTHARFLPETAKHSFTYPMVALLLPLRELEAGELDRWSGRLLGYGGISWRVCGIRADGYLFPEPNTNTIKSGIRQKLLRLLQKEGYSSGEFDDAWLLTMPAYCGFEGINPLSVYYCYRPDGTFYMAVLEIHNTFSETHVHFLRVDSPSAEAPVTGYAHQWTFPRSFHVSPFNDRSGFYTISLTPPSLPPPSIRCTTPSLSPVPLRPKIRIHQLESSSALDPCVPGSLKLSAVQTTRVSLPLTSNNLLRSLIARPFVLFLSMVRICYHAWILHYRKGLDIYVCPEPVPTRPPLALSSISGDGHGAEAGVGVRFQEAGPMEEYARKQAEAFIQHRALALQMRVVLASANALVPPLAFPLDSLISAEDEPKKELTIWYRSPQFFSLLFVCPTPQHALVLGALANDDFVVSDERLFLSLFSFYPPALSSSPSYWQGVAQRLRYSNIPATCRAVFPWHAEAHWLDTGSTTDVLRSVVALARIHVSAWLEERVYALARVHFLPGQEPWERWERAARSEKVRLWIDRLDEPAPIVGDSQ